MKPMIDLFDRIYSRLSARNLFSRSLRFSLRVLANGSFKLRSVIRPAKRPSFAPAPVIVSLTSFPARINKLWLVTESLLAQDYPDIRVLLWLSSGQFPDPEQLPQRLREQQKRGLEICWVGGDLRSHKKYYYAFREFPESIVITVDDDILYPSGLVSRLMQAHRRFPGCVCCTRAHKMVAGADGLLKSYADWEEPEPETPSACILPTGVGGVLYPPHCYDARLFDEKAIRQTCFHADDLWLNFMCRIKGTPAVQTQKRFGLITVLASQKQSLTLTNVGQGENDRQIRKITAWSRKELNRSFTSGTGIRSSD